MFFHKGLVKQVLLMAVLALVPVSASAQRTAKGQGMITLTGTYPLGGELSYGGYLNSSFWEAGAIGLFRTHSLGEVSPMDYAQALAFGDWMYRLAGTRNRVLNLYIGGGAFLGYEFYDPWNKLTEGQKESLSSSGTFLYGILGKLQLQLFLSRSLSILLSAEAPVNFTSPITWIQPCGSLGLRLDL